MDTVTHSLVGAAISDCWFRRRLGPMATPFALAMSALPDADIVTFLVSPEYAWAHHRGYTHSFLPMLLAAPLLGYIGYRIGKREGSWKEWTLLAVLCLFAHTVFDLITSWGTMPFLPFSNARVSWDIAPIIDVFLTSVTAASFVANRLLRWERVDHFVNPMIYPVVHKHPRRRRAADWVGKVAVALVACYLLIGWLQNRQTVRIAREELANAGIEAVEVRALPIMFTYLAWDIVARDAAGTVYNAAYSSYAPRPMRFTAYRTQDGDAVRRALESPDGRLFAWYSQGMFVSAAEEEPTGTLVRLYDRRFFSPTSPDVARFAMELRENASGRIESAVSRQMGVQGVRIEDELRGLWNLIVHGEVFPEKE